MVTIFFFLIYGCVTVSEHHHFVKRELVEEMQSLSPALSALGAVLVQQGGVVPCQALPWSPLDPTSNTCLGQTVDTMQWGEWLEEHLSRGG